MPKTNPARETKSERLSKIKAAGAAIGAAIVVVGCNPGGAPSGSLSATVGSQSAPQFTSQVSYAFAPTTALYRQAAGYQVSGGSVGQVGGAARQASVVQASTPPNGMNTDGTDGWVASAYFGGDPELDVGAPELGTHWGDLLAEAGDISCPGAACPTDAWRAVVEQGRSLDLRDRVALVNQFVLREIRYQEDPEHRFGTDDWKTPARAVELGRGDCEDFAVAQYFLLRAMGTPARFLRLVRTDEPGPLDHIALAVSFTDRIVVMDYDGLWGPERYGPLIGSMNENRVWAHADPFGRGGSEGRSVAGIGR